jgi:hypothetical protein
MTDTSIWPYFVIMAIFLAESSILQNTIPFYKRTLERDFSDENLFVQIDGLRGILATAVFFTHAVTFRQQWSTGTWALPHSTFYPQLAIADRIPTRYSPTPNPNSSPSEYSLQPR